MMSEDPLTRRPSRRSTLTQQQRNQKRQRATQLQLHILEQEFNQNPTPTAAVRERIAHQINMTERSVQIWFQNRRAKLKNIAKKNLKSGHDCCPAVIPNSMRRYLAAQAFETNGPHTQFLLARGMPYDSAAALLFQSDQPHTKVVIHHLACRSLTIGSWRRIGQTAMDLVIFYSPEKSCVTYYINNDSAGYKIEYPFSSIKSITLSPSTSSISPDLTVNSDSSSTSGPSPSSTTEIEQNAAGASSITNDLNTFAGLIVQLTCPPKFYTDSSGSGGFFECSDFTEDQQASRVLVHHLEGHPKVLSCQLAKLLALKTFQDRHSQSVDLTPPLSAIPNLSLSVSSSSSSSSASSASSNFVLPMPPLSAPVSPVDHRPSSQPSSSVASSSFPLSLSHPHAQPNLRIVPEPLYSGASVLHPAARGHKRQRSRSVPAALDFSLLRPSAPVDMMIPQHLHLQLPASSPLHQMNSIPAKSSAPSTLLTPDALSSLQTSQAQPIPSSAESAVLNNAVASNFLSPTNHRNPSVYMSMPVYPLSSMPIQTPGVATPTAPSSAQMMPLSVNTVVASALNAFPMDFGVYPVTGSASEFGANMFSHPPPPSAPATTSAIPINSSDTPNVQSYNVSVTPATPSFSPHIGQINRISSPVTLSSAGAASTTLPAAVLPLSATLTHVNEASAKSGPNDTSTFGNEVTKPTTASAASSTSHLTSIIPLVDSAGQTSGPEADSSSTISSSSMLANSVNAVTASTTYLQINDNSVSPDSFLRDLDVVMMMGSETSSVVHTSDASAAAAGTESGGDSGDGNGKDGNEAPKNLEPDESITLPYRNNSVPLNYSQDVPAANVASSAVDTTAAASSIADTAPSELGVDMNSVVGIPLGFGDLGEMEFGPDNFWSLGGSFNANGNGVEVDDEVVFGC